MRTIVGSSLAALVATAGAAKRGEPIRLVKHKGAWGGHFAGIDANDCHYDAGMAIVELTSTNIEEQPAWDSYDTGIRNDVGRFFGALRDQVEALVPIRQIDQPNCYFRGRWFKDFLLCNDFEIFEAFTEIEKSEIAKELSSRDRGSWLHASNKVKMQDVHSAASYQQSSLFNHGAIIHKEVIDAFAKKLSNVGSAVLSSLYHRRFWCPLYYPETLAQAARGELKSFGNTVIDYPIGAAFNQYAKVLLTEIENSDCADIIDEAIQAIYPDASQIELKNGEKLDYSSLAWAGSIAECQNVLGIQSVVDPQSARANMAFDFVLIHHDKLQKDFSILFVIDTDIPCYRVTNLSNCSGVDEPYTRVIVEYNADYVESFDIELSKEAISALTVNCLQRLGIIDDETAVLSSSVKIIPRLLPFPSVTYEKNVNANIDTLVEFDIELFGESSPMTTRSFADQFVQGIKYAVA